MKGYFNHIRFKYDTETCRDMKEYYNETKKLAQQQERLRFLLTCRSYGITPNHTRNLTTQVTQFFKCDEIKRQILKIERSFHDKILNLEISQTNKNIISMKRKIQFLRNRIENVLSLEDHTTFTGGQNERMLHMRTKIKETHESKLNTLKENHFRAYGFVFNPHWFENRTTVKFPIECEWLLSLGKKFSLPVDAKSFSPIDTIADVEQTIQEVDEKFDRERDTIRAKLANNITNFKRKIKNKPKERFILAVYNRTRGFLKKHRDIVIIQADKGNKTVAMRKEEYEDKMEYLLQDKSTYRGIRIDPTPKLLRQNNNIVTELYKNDHIDMWQKKKLLCSAATAPRIYGLPKIHKPGIPLRPIVSSVNVPCYETSKFLGRILKNLISEKYNIKNSMELKEKLANVKTKEKHILVSFDVVSLFTNIPINTAIKIIMKKWDTLRKFTKMSTTKFLEMLKFCLVDNNYFMYKDKIYHQVFGMPMGNPLSPTIADIVLDNILDDALKELEQKGIHLKFITKYVDDILAIIDKDDKDEILKTLNNQHKKIKFTLEIETNEKISYLDTTICRIGNKLIFDWYAKPTSSGRLMNFNSTQPRSQIINTANNFIRRIFNISDRQFYKKNIEKIHKILMQNSFPKKIINNLISKATAPIKNAQSVNNNISKEKQKHFAVQYIPGLTDNKNIRETLNRNNISFGYKPNKTLTTIFSKIKAPIEKQQKNNIVYEVKCKGNAENNCDQIYIGTTKRSLMTRMLEHKTDIEKQKESTALSQHIIYNRHTADFENVRILNTEQNERKRYTKESLYIQKNINKTMNHKEDTNNIHFCYKFAIT